MTKNLKATAAVAGAIGSAAIAAALLYVNRHKTSGSDEGQPPRTSKAPKAPSGEPGQTD